MSLVLNGFDEGVVKGFDEGVVEGLDEGFVEGFDEGILKGFDEGVVKSSMRVSSKVRRLEALIGDPFDLEVGEPSTPGEDCGPRQGQRVAGLTQSQSLDSRKKILRGRRRREGGRRRKE